MNAAAKMIHQSNVFSGQFADLRLPKVAWIQLLLFGVVLLSALAVVYVTNQHRMTIAQLQRAEQKAHKLQLHWGQLLLEQASLSTPARVQQFATEKLKMAVPTNQRIKILSIK